MKIEVFFARDVDIRDVADESDSKIVFDTPLGLCTLHMILSNILTGVVHKLQGSALVSHVKQHGNRLAQEIDSSDNYVT